MVSKPRTCGKVVDSPTAALYITLYITVLLPFQRILFISIDVRILCQHLSRKT